MQGDCREKILRFGAAPARSRMMNTKERNKGTSSGMGIIARVLCNYAASVWGIHTHPPRLASWVALEGYQVTDARLTYCLKYASRPKKKGLSVE